MGFQNESGETALTTNISVPTCLKWNNQNVVSHLSDLNKKVNVA